jgi:hydrogenase nickel incorporation protein HypB
VPDVLTIEKKVLNVNAELAARLRERFETAGVVVVNLISSPGSGKTRLLERTLELLPPQIRVALLTGDIQTGNDAERLARFGRPVRQITTGGTCHLDASMIERHLGGWNIDDLDILFIENVGNLVCPSSYDLGEEAKIVLLSVPEGEEKPLKYPSIFFRSALVLLTKMDLLPYVPFDLEAARANITRINPNAEVIEVSCQTDAGLAVWMSWLMTRVRARR